MRKGIFLIFLTWGGFLFMTGCKTTVEQNTTSLSSGLISDISIPINDAERLNIFEQKVNQYMAEHDVTGPDGYNDQLKSKKCRVNVLQPANQICSAEAVYKTKKNSVLMLGIVYNCGHCPKNHISVASAFVLTKDGVCATNYHVFQSYDPANPSNYLGLFVMDSEQNVYPIKEVLAASKQDDLALFRIDAGENELHPLAVGHLKEPGTNIHVISHPDHRFYTYTQGQINRHYIKPGTSKVRQCISAEFAGGSSGAPVLDDNGSIVGVVAGTQNIYYGPKEGIYQMTIKEIIPVSQLWQLID